jgi:hypothetical protein
MTTPSLMKRLEVLEAGLMPEEALRVVPVRQDLDWSDDNREAEKRRVLDALPRHKGLTVIIRKMGVSMGALSPNLPTTHEIL